MSPNRQGTRRENRGGLRHQSNSLVLGIPVVEMQESFHPAAYPLGFPSLQGQTRILCLGVRLTPTGRPATHRQLWDLVCIPASD